MKPKGVRRVPCKKEIIEKNLQKLIKKFFKFCNLERFFFSTSTFSSSHSGSNQYLQDSCSDTETGMCDTDSFGSRLSGNGSGSIAGEFKHIKEEIENDEDYFRLLANQTRTMRHFDGKYDSTFLHETFQTRLAPLFLPASTIEFRCEFSSIDFPPPPFRPEG